MELGITISGESPLWRAPTRGQCYLLPGHNLNHRKKKFCYKNKPIRAKKKKEKLIISDWTVATFIINLPAPAMLDQNSKLLVLIIKILLFQLPASKKPGKPLIISDIRKGSIAHRFVKSHYIIFIGGG